MIEIVIALRSKLCTQAKCKTHTEYSEIPNKGTNKFFASFRDVPLWFRGLAISCCNIQFQPTVIN